MFLVRFIHEIIVCTFTKVIQHELNRKHACTRASKCFGFSLNKILLKTPQGVGCLTPADFQ